MSVNLGDFVRDTISGFEGIAVSRHSYLQGCARISVQPKAKEDKLPVPEGFDEPQLEVIKPVSVSVKEPDRTKGGPERFADKGKNDA